MGIPTKSEYPSGTFHIPGQDEREEDAAIAEYQLLEIERSKGIVHVNEVNGPPLLFVDAHMHIQSSRTSTLPFLHDSVPFNLNRSKIEAAGRNAGGVAPGLEKGTKATAGTSYDVAQRFLEQAELQKLTFKTKEPYRSHGELIMCCAVMTMDMEYAHLGGYFGLKIYNPIYASEEARRKGERPLRYWYPRECSLEVAGKVTEAKAGLYPDEGETQDQFNARPLQTVITPVRGDQRKEGVIMGGVYDPSGKRTGSVPLRCVFEDAPEEEVDLYQNWKTQLSHTEVAAIGSKLTLLPMYHYDPRRWQAKDNTEAFKNVGPGGIFLGFKMYTAQGYRPWDPRIPNLKGYYATCERDQIPILNHCTPDGAPTYDKKAYIQFKHPWDTGDDEEQKRKSMKPHEKAMSPGLPPEELQRNLAADSYFTENFVSPRAWRVVLDKYPKLRLCLAHFGGKTKEGKDWGFEIIKMIEENEGPQFKYPNLYVDISSSFAYEDFRKHFKEKLLPNHPRLLGRILFGTDWYLTLLSNVDFRKYCREAKEFLDGIDPSYWLKFTRDNPYRFYRLGSQIGRIAENILKGKETESSRKDSKLLTWKSEEAKRDAKYAEEANSRMKTHAEEIRRRSKLIQDMATRLAP